MTVVRPAVPRDVEHLAELMRQEVMLQEQQSGIFRLHPHIDWQAYASARLRHRKSQIFVAERDARLVGFLELRISPPDRPTGLRSLPRLLRRLLGSGRQAQGGLVSVEDLYVLPTSREEGIAIALLERGRQWLKARDLKRVRGGIWYGNKASLQLSQKLGAEPIGLMMVKKL
jgi:GNAT superfamily N-acetyltransferase